MYNLLSHCQGFRLLPREILNLIVEEDVVKSKLAQTHPQFNALFNRDEFWAPSLKVRHLTWLSGLGRAVYLKYRRLFCTVMGPESGLKVRKNIFEIKPTPFWNQARMEQLALKACNAALYIRNSIGKENASHVALKKKGLVFYRERLNFACEVGITADVQFFEHLLWSKVSTSTLKCYLERFKSASFSSLRHDCIHAALASKVDPEVVLEILKKNSDPKRMSYSHLDYALVYHYPLKVIKELIHPPRDQPNSCSLWWGIENKATEEALLYVIDTLYIPYLQSHPTDTNYGRSLFWFACDRKEASEACLRKLLPFAGRFHGSALLHVMKKGYSESFIFTMLAQGDARYPSLIRKNDPMPKKHYSQALWAALSKYVIFEK